MTLQFDSAVIALQRAAKTRDAGELVERRLGDVQAFMRSELEQVENAIRAAIAPAPEPAKAAAAHLVGHGGKRVRPISLLLSAKCFSEISGRAFSEMAAVVELAHSATLLHDDVVDEGMERRGAPTSRRLYGNGVSVLSGDYLLVSALARTQEVAPQLLGELIATLGRLVNGEVIQLRGRTDLDVRETTYESILRDKTASLFSFACRAGAILGGAKEQQAKALADFGEGIGIAFQLVDDVIDYEGADTGKTLFADLLEGKLTLPLVLAIQKDPTLEGLVARIHSGDDEVVAEVSRRVLESGTCDVVRARAQNYTDRAIASLSCVPSGPARALLEVVAREMIRRRA